MRPGATFRLVPFSRKSSWITRSDFSYSPSPIDKVVRRPVFVVECRPDRMVAVYRDGEGDSQIGDGLFHVHRIFLEAELRRVDADDNQAGIFVLFFPRPDVWKLAQTVNTRVSPEVDQ